MKIAVIVALAVYGSIASAQPPSEEVPLAPDPMPTRGELRGTLRDVRTEIPIEGATVFVSSDRGLEHTVMTDAKGRYRLVVRPDEYRLVFAYGLSRTSTRVKVLAGMPAHVDLAMEATEVIEIEDRINPPPVLPKVKNYDPVRAPRYSEAAILSDVWRKAWFLLEVDTRGVVTRYKYLQRPGYDLDAIAVEEIEKLVFSPGRDAENRPVTVGVLWSVEWPSAGWLEKLVGNRTRLPGVTGHPPRRLDANVPCGNGDPKHRMGMKLDSRHPVYRDCSRPDLAKAAKIPWVTVRR
jgi:hypothetical protein